jgi:hypothetical protein
LSEGWKETAACDEKIKRMFFYAFLRNRLVAVASDFPFLMAK